MAKESEKKLSDIRKRTAEQKAKIEKLAKIALIQDEIKFFRRQKLTDEGRRELMVLEKGVVGVKYDATSQLVRNLGDNINVETRIRTNFATESGNKYEVTGLSVSKRKGMASVREALKATILTYRDALTNGKAGLDLLQGNSKSPWVGKATVQAFQKSQNIIKFTNIFIKILKAFAVMEDQQAANAFIEQLQSKYKVFFRGEITITWNEVRTVEKTYKYPSGEKVTKQDLRYLINLPQNPVVYRLGTTKFRYSQRRSE